MSFGTNLQYLRKRDEMTQEEFAEKMGVSRQSVSKWELDTAFPEMEKILQICDMFGCDMDTLLRGSAEERLHTDTCGYNKMMDTFIRRITSGIALIFLAYIILLFLQAFRIGTDNVYSAIFLLLIGCSLPFFMVGVTEKKEFKRKHPVVENFYTEQQRDDFLKKYHVYISVGCILIFLSMIFVILCDSGAVRGLFKTQKLWDSVIGAGFFAFNGTAVCIFTASALAKGKYDMKMFKNQSFGRIVTARLRISAAIMLSCTAIFFLLMTFTSAQGLWVIFPIGVIICGIACVLLNDK